MQPTPHHSSHSTYRASTLAAHSLAVDRTIQAMRAHVAEPLSLAEMAEIACLSPFHYNRVFRAIVGAPPGEFFAALRLDAAKRRLLTTSLSVTDVCFDLGYASLGTFTQRFKHLIGLSPIQLRQLVDELVPVPLEPLRNGRRQAERHAAAIQLPGVSGAIFAPGSFDGPIFAALFSRPIPQGRPVACTTLTAPGPYRLAPVPDGHYYIFAAALPWMQSPLAYLLPETGLLVGGSERAVLVRSGRAGAPVDLALRSPKPTDPPILGVFPSLRASAATASARTLFALRKIEEAS